MNVTKGLTVRFKDETQHTYTELTEGEFNYLFRIYAKLLKQAGTQIKAVFGEIGKNVGCT